MHTAAPRSPQPPRRAVNAGFIGEPASRFHRMLFRFQTKIAWGNTCTDLMRRYAFKMESLAPSRSALHHLLAIFPACFAGAATASPLLDRTPAHYLVPGARTVNLENVSIAELGCNVGASCPKPRRQPLRHAAPRGTSTSLPGVTGVTP